MNGVRVNQLHDLLAELLKDQLARKSAQLSVLRFIRREMRMVSPRRRVPPVIHSGHLAKNFNLNIAKITSQVLWATQKGDAQYDTQGKIDNFFNWHKRVSPFLCSSKLEVENTDSLSSRNRGFDFFRNVCPTCARSVSNSCDMR
jgi:hypothetical protein